MILRNPVVALLANRAAGTWHPILFSTEEKAGTVTYVAKSHNKKGFSTRREALEHIDQTLAAGIPGLRKSVALDIPWDGVTNPAVSVTFSG